MKKWMIVLFMLTCMWGLTGCNDDNAENEARTEVASTDYGKVIELAQAEFGEIFKAFDNLRIEETSTMTRTDDHKEIVVQMKYSSDNGSGVYGFVYHLDAYANPELVQHGEAVTIDNLLK